MAIEIKLDASAVQGLIDSDASFALRLQDAVVAEMTKRVFSKSVPGTFRDVIEATSKTELQRLIAEDEAARKIINDVWTKTLQSVRDRSSGKTTLQVTPEAQAAIANAVNAAFSAVVTEKIESVRDRIEKRIDERFKELEKQIDGLVVGRLDHNVAVAVNRRADDLFRKALAAVAPETA